MLEEYSRRTANLDLWNIKPQPNLDPQYQHHLPEGACGHGGKRGLWTGEISTCPVLRKVHKSITFVLPGPILKETTE